jgi:hypothetical protein
MENLGVDEVLFGSTRQYRTIFFSFLCKWNKLNPIEVSAFALLFAI